MINVAMIVRSTINTVKGGDTVQVYQTAHNLNRYNVSVDVLLTNEQIDYSRYDLLHFFNITRPADMLIHIRKSGKPFVVSPIFIDYSEYDRRYRKGLPGFLLHFFNRDGIEYIKTIGRWLSGKDKLVSKDYLWKGQRRSIREILKKARLLLPNSHAEYQRIVAAYHCKTTYLFVPNGIDESLFKYDPSVPKDPLLVICVARIEGIKNQLNLVLALRNTPFTVLIIGAPAPNQQGYYERCREAAGANIHFLGHLPQAHLVDYYQRANVNVLPSWFETTGLSSLEAAAMGCKIVITQKGDAPEYFGEDAFYCDPADPLSIYDAVVKAAEKPVNELLQRKIITQYTWHKATSQTLVAYEGETKYGIENRNTRNSRYT
jgi:glycosyltransferase involved in cell wall biosynthesis